MKGDNMFGSVCLSVHLSVSAFTPEPYTPKRKHYQSMCLYVISSNSSNFKCNWPKSHFQYQHLIITQLRHISINILPSSGSTSLILMKSTLQYRQFMA